jgi:hypothetical protein
MVCTSPVASTMRCGLPRLDSTMLDSSLEKPTLSAWDRSAGKASISAVRTLTTTTPFALGSTMRCRSLEIDRGPTAAKPGRAGGMTIAGTST